MVKIGVLFLDSEMTLQESQFQRYTRQEAELADNPEGKESFLKESVLALILSGLFASYLSPRITRTFC